jgi:ferredoxin
MTEAIGARVLLSRERFNAILRALRDDGYELLGPTVRDGAIVYDRLESDADLPAGVGDEQAPGRYRLRERGDGALFGFAVGPHSYKRELFAPTVRLFRVRKSARGPEIEVDPAPSRKLALIGARACEIAAIGVQDRVLLEGPHADADYAARRRDVLVIAVQCAESGGTCFCASMGTGPRATAGFDLALTELTEGEHRFVCEIGSERGAALVAKVGSDQASLADREAADAVVARTATRMGRTLDTSGIKELLQSALVHPRWDEVATRCLSCANCTMVCPTCFCSTVEDTTDLAGDVAERTRRWDSCFTLEHSYVHGGAVRPSLAARYRQWLTHKLAHWIDQFGTSGCVGCGRCITWCPVGIDITEEVAAIRAAPADRAAEMK